MALTLCTGNSTAVGISHLQAHWEALAGEQRASPALGNRNVWRRIPQDAQKLQLKGSTGWKNCRKWKRVACLRPSSKGNTKPPILLWELEVNPIIKGSFLLRCESVYGEEGGEREGGEKEGRKLSNKQLWVSFLTPSFCRSLGMQHGKWWQTRGWGEIPQLSVQQWHSHECSRFYHLCQSQTADKGEWEVLAMIYLSSGFTLYMVPRCLSWNVKLL